MSICLGKCSCAILNLKASYVSGGQDYILLKLVPGHRTADHILTVKTLIDKHVNHRNEPIYALLILNKAFDSVSHQGLFHKLLSYDIKHNIYKLIKDLYSKSSCATN